MKDVHVRVGFARFKEASSSWSLLRISKLMLLCGVLAFGCSQPAAGGGAAGAPGASPASPPAGDPAPSSAGPGAQPGAGQASAPKEPETSGLLDCDPGKIMCRRMAPACPQGQVPSVSGSCYGPCVAIERCACSAAAQCPQPDQHTCWRAQHCGPFVR